MTTSFTLLTLNCFGVPAPGTADRLRLLADVLNQSDADIVCLQEVQTHIYRRLLVASASAYPFHAFAPFVHAPKGGLLTLSRHPLSASQFMLYDERGPWYTPAVADWILHKGVLCACLSVAETPVIILNTHLNANYSGDWSRGSLFARAEQRQLRQLAQIASGQPADTLVLVAGDFNIPRASWLYDEFIAASGLTDPLASDMRPTYRALPGMPTRYTAPIDFTLVRPPHGMIVRGSAELCFENKMRLPDGRRIFLSDHLGVRVTLSWPA